MRIDGDADGRNGGAKRTVWEMLMDMERFKYRAGGSMFGSSSPGAGPGEGIWACQPPSGAGLGNALQLPKEHLAGALWVLRAPEASAV